MRLTIFCHNVWLLCLLSGAFCLPGISGSTQPKPMEPKVGSALRKAILDGLRPTVEKDLKQKVVFKVNALRVQGDFAFLDGVPQQPNGKAIDYKKTKYRDALEADAFDDSVFALMKKGKQGWRVVAFVIGPTDVAWEDWPQRFKAPRAIFGFGN